MNPLPSTLLHLLHICNKCSNYSTGSGFSFSPDSRYESKAGCAETRASILVLRSSPIIQDARRKFRPFFDSAPVYGSGPSMEDFMEQTPLTVGSPQEVIEKTLSFRDYAGDYQRQMFLIDMRSGVKDRAGIARSVG